MSKYSVKIELINATPEHYLVLNNQMHDHGFMRIIKDINQKGKLEFIIESSGTIEEVRELAKKCAESTGKHSSLLISSENGRTLYLVPPLVEG